MSGSDGNRVIDAAADGESLIRFCGRQDSTCARPPIWILIGGARRTVPEYRFRTARIPSFRFGASRFGAGWSNNQWMIVGVDNCLDARYEHLYKILSGKVFLYIVDWFRAN